MPDDINPLLRYADHLRGCASYTNGACTCGLESVMRELDASPSYATASDAANEAANKIADYFNAPPSVVPAIEQIVARCFKGNKATLHDETERDVMIDTIKQLEKDRDALRQVASMALQQFEFTYGKRARGWDAAFLMERLSTVIADSDGSGDCTAPVIATGNDERDRDRCPISGCDKEVEKGVPGPPRIPGQWYCLRHRHLMPKTY